jgi:hypothetical protein
VGVSLRDTNITIENPSETGAFYKAGKMPSHARFCSQFRTNPMRQLIDWLCGGRKNAAGKLKAGTLTPSKTEK